VKKLIILFSIIYTMVFGLKAQTQLPPAISQYMFNPMSSNPAYAGFYDMTSISNLFRGQIRTANSKMNLFTNTFNVHSSLPLDKMGAGLNVTYDQVGITSAFNLDLALSYKLTFGSNKLSLGAQGTFFSAKNNFDKLEYVDAGYQQLYIPNDNSAINKPNFGLGLMYAGRKFFGGISVPRLFGIEENFQFVNVQDPTQTYQYGTRYQPYYTASVGKIIHYKNILELKPSIMTKYVSKVGLLADVNFSVLYHQTFWFGLSVRNSVQNPDKASAKRIFTAFSSLGLMAQAQLTDRFKAGFSYDVILNTRTLVSQKIGKAPFEIMLNYNLAVFDEQGVHTFLF
jgi:type IX secretion system PorP/SprF family membrane protein